MEYRCDMTIDDRQLYHLIISQIYHRANPNNVQSTKFATSFINHQPCSGKWLTICKLMWTFWTSLGRGGNKCSDRIGFHFMGMKDGCQQVKHLPHERPNYDDHTRNHDMSLIFAHQQQVQQCTLTRGFYHSWAGWHCLHSEQKND